jgi:hypothetical protein
VHWETHPVPQAVKAAIAGNPNGIALVRFPYKEITSAMCTGKSNAGLAGFPGEHSLVDSTRGTAAIASFQSLGSLSHTCIGRNKLNFIFYGTRHGAHAHSPTRLGPRSCSACLPASPWFTPRTRELQLVGQPQRVRLVRVSGGNSPMGTLPHSPDQHQPGALVSW